MRLPSGPVSITPNSVALVARHPDAGHGQPGARIDVGLDHLRGVHPVHVVGAEHDHVVGLLVVEQVERLVDGVGAALVPARAPALLGRHRRHVVADQRRHPPRERDVPVE